MAESITTPSPRPESSNSNPGKLEIIDLLLKTLREFDLAYHPSMGIYISLTQNKGISQDLFFRAVELKQAVENFDEALHREIKVLCSNEHSQEER